MDEAFSQVNGKKWNAYLFETSLDDDYLNYLEEYLKLFEQHWDHLFSDIGYDLCQINTGNRLRPIISLLGYLLNNRNVRVEEIVDFGLGLELIHKASLVLDDLVDDDNYRHGKPTFHFKNGNDKAIAIASYLISKSFFLTKESLIKHEKSDHTQLKYLDLSINILHDMSSGLLKELSMIKEDFSKLSLAKEIIHQEVSSIIRNALLCGYYLRERPKSQTVDLLSILGEDFGYLFQVMNDMEPLVNSASYKKHKRTDRLEIFQERKNIVVTYILQNIGPKEEKKIWDNSSQESVLESFNSLFIKLGVEAVFLEEIDKMESKIIKTTMQIQDHEGDEKWVKNCTAFVQSLVKIAKKRIQSTASNDRAII